MRKWKKSALYLIGYVILFLLAGMVMYQLNQSNKQAIWSSIIPAKFLGEYSIDGGEWKPLDENTKLPAFDGDVLLRGKFEEQYPGEVSFYLNHIGVSIAVNGENVFESGRWEDTIPEIICGSYWSGWSNGEIDEKDTLEIRLHNPHHYGNANAFNQFLHSLVRGGEFALENYARQGSDFYFWIGTFLLVISIVLLGIALGYLTQRLPMAGLLFSMGMMTLSMGGYILMDTMDTCFRSKNYLFNICMRQYCMMFAGLEFANCIRKTLTGKKRKAANVLTLMLGVSDGVLLTLSLLGVIEVFDGEAYWAVISGLAAVVFMGICIRAMLHGKRDKRLLLGVYVVFLGAALIELINGRMNFLPGGLLIKIVFMFLLMYLLVRAVRVVAFHHRTSIEAEKLEEKLRNSRIVLAMSQIRTHFIFNVLNAISGMCKYDAQKADETVVRFANYLRSNIDIMQEDEPIPFFKELEHLGDYVVLEQVRFGDRISFRTELEVTDFQIPPLVLQPIVENSIKHGILPKGVDGTIYLSTKNDGANIVITIEDDGIGFSKESEIGEDSVGLSNVRFRLEYMVDGKLEIRSREGQGTTVIIKIPFPQKIIFKENENEYNLRR
ncbi:MAG: histidine kinase [Firmicutes bacterium]|nr:histidine kinase [Bacillota bacterium]